MSAVSRLLPTDGDTVVTEGGEPDYYDIVLTTAPVSEVYILINHIAGQVTAVSDADGSGALIFTPDNWYVPQTVRVTAIDDTIEEPLLPAYISHTIGSVDESYQQAFALQERAFVRDNDSTDQVGPKITDVIVSSSTWSPEFINAVDGVGEGNGLGVSVVGAHQLDNLPWNTIDKIYIQFDESVAADFSASNIQLTGINTPSYDSKLSMAFGVDGENVGTITFSSPITSDVLSLTLSDSIRDAAGNRLDGDWSNGVSLVSGNGSNGGSFNFRIEALPGDVDDSGGVTFVDVFAALSQSGALVTSPELSRLDIDGNGGINLIDVFAIYNRNGQILPSADSGSGSGSALSAVSKGAPDQSEANGVFGTTILPGYGGIAQAVTPGGRPAAELDRINPFLRRALMRAESLVQSEANLVSQLKETSADGNLSQSIPAIDSYFRQTENSLALSADHVFGRLGSAPLYQGVRSDLKVSPLDAMRSQGQIESSQLLADDSVLLTDDDSANEDVESRPLESASLAIDSSLRLRRNHSLGSYSLPGRE